MCRYYVPFDVHVLFAQQRLALEGSHGSVSALRWIPVVAVSINTKENGMILYVDPIRGGLNGLRMIQSWMLKGVFDSKKVPMLPRQKCRSTEEGVCNKCQLAAVSGRSN
jgi:hypothetical protein